MLKSVKFGLAIFLGASLILSGCSNSNSKVTETPKPQAEKQQAEKPQVIELKYSDWHTTAMGLGKIHEKAVKMVEERTNGRVKLVPYFGGTLLKFGDIFNGVSTGVADISLYMHGATPGVQPLNEVFKLPLGFTSQQNAVRGYKEILEKFPEIQKENEKYGMRWLALGPMPSYTINMTKKPVRLPKDLKGENVSASAIFARVATSAGSGATNVPPGDVFGAAEKNVISGFVGPMLALTDFKTDEVFKYHTILEPGMGVYGYLGFLVNLETWNKLTPDDQKVLVDVFQWAVEERIKDDSTRTQKALDEYKKDPQRKVIQVTDEEAKLWTDMTKGYVEDWIKNTEGKGWPAREIYEGAKEVAKQQTAK